MTAHTFTIPIRLMSEANRREHWAAKARRTKDQRAHVTLMLRTTIARIDPADVHVVSITRVAPRMLDDDNATRSAKAVRDAIAEWLGVNDGDRRILWRVSQERGPYAVTIRIWTGDEGLELAEDIMAAERRIAS
jgi:hypothetical protein